jgi:hypothetical protein
MEDMAQLIPVDAPARERVRVDEAVVNVTWQGQNAELPNPVSRERSDDEVIAMVTEAIRAGMPGIRADENVTLRGWRVDRDEPNATTPWHRMTVRPKTAYGALALRAVNSLKSASTRALELVKAHPTAVAAATGALAGAGALAVAIRIAGGRALAQVSAGDDDSSEYDGNEDEDEPSYAEDEYDEDDDSDSEDD